MVFEYQKEICDDLWNQLCVPDDDLLDLDFFPNFYDDLIQLNGLPLEEELDAHDLWKDFHSSISSPSIFSYKHETNLSASDETSPMRSRSPTCAQEQETNFSVFRDDESRGVFQDEDSRGNAQQKQETNLCVFQDEESYGEQETNLCVFHDEESRGDAQQETNLCVFHDEESRGDLPVFQDDESRADTQQETNLRVFQDDESRVDAQQETNYESRGHGQQETILWVFQDEESRSAVIAHDVREESSKKSSVRKSCLSVKRWMCSHCKSEKTPQWREGPNGPKTLCNACGVRYKSGRLLPEYRPAASPSFDSSKHSNFHKRIVRKGRSYRREME